MNSSNIMSETKNGAKPLPPRKEIEEKFAYDRSTGKLINRRDYGPRVRAGEEAGTYSHGYRQVKLGPRNVRVHRIVYFLETGEQPAEIDHIDRNRANNHISNLRPATRSLQRYNSSMHKNNSLGIRGVYRHQNGYRAHFGANGGKVKRFSTNLTRAAKMRRYMEEGIIV